MKTAAPVAKKNHIVPPIPRHWFLVGSNGRYVCTAPDADVASTLHVPASFTLQALVHIPGLARELRPCQFPATVTVLKRAARLPIGRRSIRPDRRPRHAVAPEN